MYCTQYCGALVVVNWEWNGGVQHVARDMQRGTKPCHWVGGCISHSLVAVHLEIYNPKLGALLNRGLLTENQKHKQKRK